MENIKLSSKAMKIIGRELGINDINSPITDDNKLFYDRVHLFEPYIYIRDLIETYNNELQSFDNEDDYIKYIEAEEKKIYECIEDYIDKSDYDLDRLPRDRMISVDINNKRFKSVNILEIRTTDKVYDAMMFMCKDKQNLPDTQNNFIRTITDCKYLINRNKIDINRLSRYNKAVITKVNDDISSVILFEATKIYNVKQLLSASEGHVNMALPPRVDLEFIGELGDRLAKCGLLNGVSIDIDLFRLEELIPESEMLLRVHANNTEDYVNYNNYELISYFMNRDNIDGQVVFEIDNITCRADKPIDFHLQDDCE